MASKPKKTSKKKKPTRVPPPTSADFDSIQAELHHGGDRAEIVATCRDIEKHLEQLRLPKHYWDYIELGRAQKKNFAQRFSNALAQKVADVLRPKFPGIRPDEEGRGQESKSHAAGGLKKLDVNFSNIEHGLGFAVSIKSINFVDEASKRYTKNIKRADGELRAEAQDCHKRQPYAVLVALIFLPKDAAEDGAGDVSSLYHAWDVYSRRGGRKSTDADVSLFESVFIGLYESAGESAGTVVFLDVADEPPKRGMPTKTIKFSTIIQHIERTYRERNRT
jgi:hypothetical protein